MFPACRHLPARGSNPGRSGGVGGRGRSQELQRKNSRGGGGRPCCRPAPALGGPRARHPPGRSRCWGGGRGHGAAARAAAAPPPGSPLGTGSGARGNRGGTGPSRGPPPGLDPDPGLGPVPASIPSRPRSRPGLDPDPGLDPVPASIPCPPPPPAMKPPGAVGTLLRALGRRDSADTPPAPHSFREKALRRGGGVRGLPRAPRPPGPRLQSVQGRQPRGMRGQGDVTVRGTAPPPSW
ncbi:uncharacterized protein LOC142365162 [Opisthocomus hoazin]|uniref:uncharacterized protein LOC142365162 n=1 Tax=Opisthocomus hoazin TaxID=30419 RepID=UPI003F53C682